jgi:energy-converting hydrogenase Eha subunit E
MNAADLTDVPEPLRSMLRFDGGSALDADGRVGEDVPCVHCRYNLRTLRGDARCPECGQAVLDTLNATTGPVALRQWVQTVAQSLDAVGWSLICLAVTVAAAAVGFAAPLRDGPLLGLALVLGLFAVSVALLFLLVGMGGLVAPPPRRATLTRLAVPLRRWAGVSLLLLPVLALLVCGGFVAVDTRELATLSAILRTLPFALFPGLWLLHVHTLLRLSGRPAVCGLAWLGYLLLALAAAAALLPALPSDARWLLAGLAAALGLASYGYAVRSAGRSLLAASTTLPNVDPEPGAAP